MDMLRDLGRDIAGPVDRIGGTQVTAVSEIGAADRGDQPGASRAAELDHESANGSGGADDQSGCAILQPAGIDYLLGCERGDRQRGTSDEVQFSREGGDQER
ncbi:MAG: hypothetical protein M0030_13275 [Actinomycetota bacterium]|nr:hypothetical protein [Actinomycetota bacterium]